MRLFSRRRTLGFAASLWVLALAPASAQRPEGPFTFCAYNLKNWLFQKPIGAPEDAPAVPKPEKEKGRVIAFLGQISPDVLGVCEIGTEQDLADLRERLKAAGIDLPHLEFNRAADPTRSLALLSKFPITLRNSQPRLAYQMGAGTYFMQRGILDASVAFAPGWEVRFVGVHLKSKRQVAEVDEALMRRNEAHLLRRHLDGIFDRDVEAKVICYGDFNEHRHEPAISAIIGSRASPGYMADLFLRDEHGLVWTHFWDAADVYSRFDYFFVSRPLRPHIDSRKSYIFSAPDFDQASDHRPIVLTLRIPRSKAK
jgi:endonuclease/exonuclease/phosphatase family metal-dependent hydrolase